jgi:hypothetical protein
VDDDRGVDMLAHAAPEPEGDRLVFVHTDETAKRGRTYRYAARYEADVRLLSDVVFLSVPADGSAWSAPSAGRLTVEIVTPNLAGAGTALLLQARSNATAPEYTWRSVSPGITTVLASHGGAALVRVEDVLGYSAASVEVVCRAGGEVARDSVWVPALKMIWTQEHTVDAERVLEARADPSVVGVMLREQFGPKAAYGMGIERLEEFVKAVGEPAVREVLDYAAECEDLSTRVKLYGLAASLDARLAIATLRECRLDECLTMVLVGLAHRLGPGRSAEAATLLSPFLSHESPMVRARAASALGSVGTRGCAKALEELRIGYPVGRVRFAAGWAIRRVRRHRTGSWETPPPWGRAEMSAGDVALARRLLSEALADLDRPREVLRQQTFAVLGGGGGEMRVAAKPVFADDFDWWLWPGSAGARLAALGQAAVPAIAERLFALGPSKLEMELMQWVLAKTSVELPEHVRTRVAERVLAAGGEDRRAALDWYMLYWRAWGSGKGMDDETVAAIRRRMDSSSPAERLRALGQIQRYVGRTDWAELYGRRDRLRGAAGIWDRRAIKLALELRSGDDAAAAIAREMWPVDDE